MMRTRNRPLARELDAKLRVFHRQYQNLVGLQELARREVFIAQVVESIRRVEYVSVIRARNISERRLNPNDEMFDPLKAAVLFQRAGKLDEAFWMVFYFVHFGKHNQSGWQYARRVYGRLGETSGRWDWVTTADSPEAFRAWLLTHEDEIRVGTKSGGFGNHRKYQSLSAQSNTGTGAAFETYIKWVRPPRSHEELIWQFLERNNHDPRETFRELYRDMSRVASFGRTARFDYLTMIAKLGLAPIEADSTYMQGSTGPMTRARLLFGTKYSATQLDNMLLALESVMGVGMQVIEDALCNWQKSPAVFVPFRG